MLTNPIRTPFPADNKRIRRCRPRCDPDCINGKCIEATTCVCNAGYQMHNGSRNQCDPLCQTPCGPNSHCVAPNVCACNEGFVRPPAANATACFERCSAPGYEMLPTGECAPLCPDGCPNGRCVQPGQCECAVGFAASTPGARDCAPQCDGPCANGECVAPNRCECIEGFALVADGDDECRPVCEPACVNGRCTGPGRCSCEEGECKAAKFSNISIAFLITNKIRVAFP